MTNLFGFHFHKMRGDSVTASLDAALGAIQQARDNAADAKELATVAMRALADDIRKSDAVPLQGLSQS